MTTPVAPITALNSRPDYQSEAYKRMQPDWEVCNDVKKGTRHMRSLREKYLPRAPAETQLAYDRRISKSEFFNGFGRTVKGLTGMVFRRNPTLGDDMPEVLVTHWEDIDGAGTHGDVFSKTLFDDGITSGLAGILVDHPSVTDAESLTLAQVEAMNLRPYWVHYAAAQIVSAREERVGAKSVLSQLVLKEEYMQLDGEFGEKVVCRYRVFKRTTLGGKGIVTYQLWQEVVTNGVKTLAPVGTLGIVANQEEIPFSPFIAGDRLGCMETRPPLLDLAYTNIAHWQVQSDHRYSMHLASIPILVFKGRQQLSEGEEKEVVVGPEVGIDVDKDGDVKYVEHAGTALSATREELKDLETRMAAQGLAMLQSETRAAETAQAKRIDKAEQDSALATAARGLGDCLELAFQFHARYLNLEPGSIEVNQEFEDLTFDAGMIAALSNLEVASQISLDTLWTMLETGGILPDSFEADVEKVKILAGIQQKMDLAQQGNPDNTPPEDKGGGGPPDQGGGGPGGGQGAGA